MWRPPTKQRISPNICNISEMAILYLAVDVYTCCVLPDYQFARNGAGPIKLLFINQKMLHVLNCNDVNILNVLLYTVEGIC